MTRCRDLRGLWFAAPAAVVYLPLIAIPLAYSLYLSFHYWDGRAPAWTPAGIGNYLDMVKDNVFWRSLAHNLVLVAFSLAVQLPIAMLLAVLLERTRRLDGFMRTCVFLPYVLPTVVIALVWRSLITASVPEWLASPDWSLSAILLAVTWRFIGFHTVLYLAGLGMIDRQLYEAARIDGTSEWQCFRHITLPLMKPVIIVSATLAIVGSMKYFDVVFLMTGGDPDHATELLATYLFKMGFDHDRMGYSSAIAVALVVLALGTTVIMLQLKRGSDRRP